METKNLPLRRTGEVEAGPSPGPRARLAAVVMAVAVLFVVGGFASMRAATTDPGYRQEATSQDMSRVDRFMQDELDASSLPGAALAITRGDQVLHVRGYGHDATGAPLTGTSLFRIASLSKSMTAMAVMQLVETGHLSLDNSVASYLPEFHPSDPRGADITVHEVLNQTSGLSDRTFNELDDPQPGTLTEAVSRLNPTTLAADPGTQWNYHNPNYEVAARLVEVASGQPFDVYLREHVFLPAGMAATSTTYTDNAPVAGLADGHVMAYGHAFPIGLPDKFGAGAGDVVSTASDMANWLMVNTNRGRSVEGHRLVSENALDQMHTSSTPVGYGYGWSENRAPGSPARVGHTGNLLTFSAFQTFLPDSGYGLVLMFNSGSARTIDQAAIFEGVLDMVTGTASQHGGLELSATTLDLLLGALTIVVLAAGVLGVLRSREWMTRASRPGELGRIRAAGDLLTHVGMLGLVVAFPAIAGTAFGGRAVTWSSATYAWPAMVVLVLAILIATLAILAARGWQLARTRELGLVKTRPGSLSNSAHGLGPARAAILRARAPRALSGPGNSSIAQSHPSKGTEMSNRTEDTDAHLMAGPGKTKVKAIVQNAYGDADVLRFTEIDKPVPGEHDVLVRVFAVSLHAGDHILLRGIPYPARFFVGWPKPRNFVPGLSVAGIVESVGAAVTKLSPGDEVFGECRGACADFALGTENTLVAKPARLTFAQAAAMPTSALTAQHGLRDAAKVKPGQRVLINGASGGIGIYAVQIAKALGAEVTGVCSSANVDMVRKLGADHVIDYTTEDFVDGTETWDLIFDNVGNHSFTQLRRVLTPKGVVIPNSGKVSMGSMVGGMIRSLLTPQKDVRFISTPNRPDLLALSELIDSGKLTTVIDRTYRLDQTPEAMTYVGAGHARGKVVILVRPDAEGA